jgi:hypothetical protein
MSGRWKGGSLTLCMIYLALTVSCFVQTRGGQWSPLQQLARVE